MKVFLSSPLLFAYPLKEVLQISHDLGYDGVEVWHIHQQKYGDDPLKLRNLANKLNLSLSVHALSWDLNFTSKIEKIREVSLQLLEKSIILAEALQANPVVIHPGRVTIPEDNLEDYWELLVSGVQRLCAFSKSRKIDIALELMEQISKEFFISPEDSGRILKEVSADNLGITFDAAHVPLDQEPLEYLKKLQGVKQIHLSDLTAEKRHIALGTGVRDFQSLIKYIMRENLGNIVIEGLESKRDLWLATHNKREMNQLIGFLNQS